MKRDPIKTLKNKALRLWKEAVKKNFWYRCIQCGETKMLNAHHIQSSKMWPELRYELFNGLALCPSCHKFGKRAIHNSYIDSNLTVVHSLDEIQLDKLRSIYNRYKDKKFELTEKYLLSKINELEKFLKE